MQEKGCEGYSEKTQASSEESIPDCRIFRRKREKDATTYKSGCFGSELSPSSSKEATSPILVVDNDDNDACEKCGMHDCPVLRDQKNDG